MWKRWVLGCLMLVGMLALTACSPIGLGHIATPQHTLARDGGVRLTLQASCLPAPPSCNISQQRDAAIEVMSRRLAGRTDVSDPVVHAGGASDIVVELPGVTGDTQIADITALLTTSGAIAVLDTGEDLLPVGASTTGKTCSTTCDAGQYRIMFTGDQIDRNQVAATTDPASSKWIVQFAFAGSARRQFADYTAAHIGQYLTITLDDVVLNSAVIQSEIDGLGQITGLNQAEARQVAADLKSGSLPAAMTVVTTERVAPSAG